MLYIEDSDGAEWLRVAALLSEREPLDMILRLYPDEATDEFAPPFLPPHTAEHLECASAHPGADYAPCSARARVSAEFLAELHPFLGEFEEWGESLSLHTPTVQAWVAAYIPHRRVVLIREVRLYEFLDAAGVEVCVEPPEEW